MSSRTHLQANLDALDFNLEPDLLAAIRQVIADDKDVIWPSGRIENSDYVLHSHSQGLLMRMELPGALGPVIEARTDAGAVERILFGLANAVS